MNYTFRLKQLSVLLFMMLVSNIMQAQSTRTFRIIGYVPNWIDVSKFTQSFDFKQVTHLNYAFQNPDATGNLTESNNGLTALVAKAHANQVKVLISLGGGAAAGGTVKTNFQNLISTSAKRADFIHKIVLYLNKYKLDGLDVDEEGPAINGNYGAFIKQLADSLKPKAKLLTAAVGWGGESIPNSAFQYFDWINLMSYDYTGNWDLTNPGQHSPYWYAQQMIKDYKARGVKKEKLCLGVPFYGYGFYKTPGSFNYVDIIAKYPDAWAKDQVGDTIYYNGMSTIRKKTKLAMAESSGVMIWELSNDTKGDRSLLKVIATTVDSLSTSLTDLSNETGWRIYPNPANDYLVVRNELSEQNATIALYDMKGCLVKSENRRINAGEDLRIDISSLIKGEYVCRVTFAERSFAQQFVKV